MIEGYLRTKVQPLFDRIGQPLSQVFSPNTITLFALIFGIMCGFCISVYYFNSALVFLLCSGLCDILDGTVARITKQSKKVGAFFDLIADRLVESALIIGFALVFPQYSFAYILFLTALLFHFSTFVLSAALFENTGTKSIHHEYSLIERAEAFIVFGIMIIFPGYISLLLLTLSIAIYMDGAWRFIKTIRHAH